MRGLDRNPAVAGAALGDLAVRARVGRTARETVLQCYSVEAVAARLAALLKRAAERN